MADKYKLTYFDAPGRAVGLRVCLFKAFGKFGWVDERVSDSAEFRVLKPSLPLGSLPVLTTPGGQKRCQTDALTRWAAKKSGLYPEDVDQALMVDEVTSTVFEGLDKSLHLSNEEDKKHAADFLLKVMGLLENRIGDGPFLCGSKLTCGDLQMFMLSDMILSGKFDFVSPSTFLDSFPKVKKNHDAVKSSDLMVAYGADYPN